MTVDPSEFLNQSPEDFLSYSPEDFLAGENQAIEETKKENTGLSTEKKIAIGLGVAFLVWRTLVKRKLRESNPGSVDEAYAAAKLIWGKIAPAWLVMATPAITSAYQLSTGQVQLSEQQMSYVASEYAKNLGEYISNTSVTSLLEGFSAQLNKGVNTSVAWDRATEGVGLDSNQMRSYITQANSNEAEYQSKAVPDNILGSIQKMLHNRADRIARHEAWASMQIGKNVVWMLQQSLGIVPEGAMKQWVTAEDERVCPVCAPLDGAQVSINDKFETAQGYFWTPAIHINCRCDIKLIFPEEIEKAMGNDKFNRTEKGGRFSRYEQRKPTTDAKPVAVFKKPAKTLKYKEPTPEEAKQYKEVKDLLSSADKETPLFINVDNSSLFEENKLFEQADFSPFENKSMFSEGDAFEENQVNEDMFTVKPRRRVMRVIVINPGSKYQTVQNVVEDLGDPDDSEGPPFEKHDGKVAFAPWNSFKAAFNETGDEPEPLFDSYGKKTKMNINKIGDKTRDFIPSIGGAGIHEEPMLITGDNLYNASIGEMPIALEEALISAIKEDRSWLGEIKAENDSWESKVRRNNLKPEQLAELADGETRLIGLSLSEEEELRSKALKLLGDKPRSFMYDSKTSTEQELESYMPTIIAFSDFYTIPSPLGLNTEYDANIAGEYELTMANASDQDLSSFGSVYPHKATFKLGRSAVRNFYRDPAIRWEGSSPSEYQPNKSVYTEYPELFTDNPWVREGYVSVILASPTNEPDTHYIERKSEY